LGLSVAVSVVLKMKAIVQGSRSLAVGVSTTFENEAIATVEFEATRTEWMGDLSGGLGVDPAAGRGGCSAAAGG
jgi:hypothetical protein